MNKKQNIYIEVGDPHLIAQNLPYTTTETTLDLVPYDAGHYRLEVFKDTDPQTGGLGDVFYVPKLPELALTMDVQSFTTAELTDGRWQMAWTIATTLTNAGTAEVPAGTPIPVMWTQVCSWIEQQSSREAPEGFLWFEHVPDDQGRPKLEYHVNPALGGEEDPVELTPHPFFPPIQRFQTIVAAPMQPGDVIALNDQHFVSVVDDMDQCMTVTFTGNVDSADAIDELNNDNAVTLLGYSNLDSCGGLYEINPADNLFNDSVGVTQVRAIDFGHIIPEDILGDILNFDFYFGLDQDPPIVQDGLANPFYAFAEPITQPGTYYWRVVYNLPGRKPASSPVYTLTVGGTGDADQDGLEDWWEKRFFGGLQQTGDGDFDEDGVCNREAMILGINPRTLDADRDNVPDAWEVTNGLDPREPDGDLDLDGDGYSNRQEFERGTDPRQYLLFLRQGWNLVSISRVPPDSRVHSVFGRGNVIACFMWKGTYFSSVDHVDPLTGYWVYCPEDCVIDIGAKLPKPAKDQPAAMSPRQ
jgi:hypothetical protein